ncbi:MAG: anthranilate synthase component I family protein [Oscillospiraceae bacterium]|nr:anthranilate synthase component I family protein [Oscillospiraceae bacterium]
MYYPSLKEARALAAGGEYRRIPVSRELLSDFVTPIQALRILRARSGHCFLLESAADSAGWGRYTFLGFEPSLEVTCKDGILQLRDRDTVRTEIQHPAPVLRKLLAEHRSPRVPGLPPFTGGLVGYFAYDYLKYAEPALKLDAQDRERFQDMDLMLFEKVICFDNYRQKIVLIVNADASGLDESYPAACGELERMAALLRHGRPMEPKPGRLTTPITPLFDKETYCAMVEKGKRYIREGDIFQVVLSNRLEAGFEGSLLDAYRVLRASNPSPYMFYFTSESMELAGASPETLVKLEDGVLHTFPLAGTRPRGRTREEDLALERELLADGKELAEHNMLVDLGRNDLGKISKFGTVQVEDYMSVLRFSHIMHIGSTVRGEIREDKDALDALDAVLPAGTLSGAPKLRAMEIINELEDDKRGVYGGAVGYLDFTGNMDACIAIRLAYKKNGRVFIRAGAGIVADSVPEKEHQECLNKGRAVVEALERAHKEADL